MADRKNNKRNNRNQDDDGISKFRKPRKKVCVMCAEKTIILDYKNAEQLKKFVSDKGKILPRRASGACAKHQREVTLTIKRARHIAILPHTTN